MNDELNKEKLSNSSQQPAEQKEKTPYELYLEEKSEREKLTKTLQQKDKEYQLNLIKLDKKVSELSTSLSKKDDEIEITKAKYWNDKESDYKEAINRRQNTEEGIIVKGIYDYLDKRSEEGKHLKQKNLFFI